MNIVKNNNERLNIFKETKVNYFVDMVTNPTWVGIPLDYSIDVTRDNGISYH